VISFSSITASRPSATELCWQEQQALMDIKERYPVQFAFPVGQLSHFSAPYVSTSTLEELRKAFWREWQPTDTAEKLYRRLLTLIRA
jgi:hypothetical protein